VLAARAQKKSEKNQIPRPKKRAWGCHREVCGEDDFCAL